jgi:hypothetical protein
MQRFFFWIVHTKSHNDRHSAALATRSTPEGDPPNRLNTRKRRRYRQPRRMMGISVLVIDFGELQRVVTIVSA